MQTKQFFAAMAFLFAGVSGGVAAGTPMEDMRQTVDAVVEILRKGSGLGAAERREQLRRAIYPRFDFEEMAKRSLGQHWKKLSSGEREKFIPAFRDFLEGAYVRTIESYDGERVEYVKEKRNGSRAEVETKIVGKQSTAYGIRYSLHLQEGNWKVYDVVVEGVSLVNNYRTQFQRILAKSSYDELVRLLKEKRIMG